MTVSAILLLPHAETRERLLAPHAPSCRRVAGALTFGTITGGSASHTEQYAIKPVKSFDYPVDEHVCLVLARSGAVVPEGVDRLYRVTTWSIPRQEVDRAVMVALDGDVSLIARFRAALSEFGTLLLLDENGEVVGE